MALILNIDTALTNASVSLCDNDIVMVEEINNLQKDHASFLQPAIKSLIQKTNITLSSIDAVAVVNGPGSYTGLRVGLASAKGICYALEKPIILLNTLHVIASSSASLKSTHTNLLFSPMIDARRMEVFTALYNDKFEEIKSPSAVIIDQTYLADELQSSLIVFSGNGCFKFKEICKNPNAIFFEEPYSAKHIAALSYRSFIKKKFANNAYAEPFYVKSFYTK